MKHALYRAAVAMIVAFLVIGISKIPVKGNTFTKLATVTEIEQNWQMSSQSKLIRKDDTIVITLTGGRNDGQMYAIDVQNGTYKYNDLVEVTMNDNGTEFKFDDDEIIDIRKVGK